MISKKEFDDRCSSYTSAVNARLSELRKMYSPDIAPHQQVCADAMWYSLSAGGKRIRPILTMEFCRVNGADSTKALDSACALEMIHTFSLIHDDLPCMDDDDYRRGVLSCHKKFGEAEALLAGDALECLAFEVIASDDNLTSAQKVMLIKTLSRAVGVCGMIGGQIMDIQNDGAAYDIEKLTSMYSMKTSALIKAGCTMGCICAGAYDCIPKAEQYAEALGLAFQITDDILDITSTAEELGKPVGSDANLDKATYAAVYGLERSREKAAELTEKAAAAASDLPDSGFILRLTENLLNRKK